MQTHIAALAALALVAATPAFAGDPVIGKQKATACVICHGGENFGGIFYTLQLAGRNADKLAIKTNKYKTLKVLHPMMNMAVAFYTEKEIEDVAAYYQSIGKPFLTSPFFTIKGDDEALPAAAAAPAAAPYTVAAK
ncbi:MAG: cytochrome c class I [bacterium]|nr:MAG: cytochrome c class I [bacterium]KAF0149954.1 MAG: cytochrome c class I [bacterium]KAF0169062.1 MAG: cytochrome c class I [bacterium]TXT21532.1 MAG: cytochrome c class I [bacterium]